MPSVPLHLPIRPHSSSLESHLAALDILSLRLTSLTNKTSHPARIPLTSKASFSGEIVRTNDIIVNVGEEWWIEMTAHEAAEYVDRRKATLLEEHARLLEGHTRPPAVGRLLGPQSANAVPANEPKSISLRPILSFHPLFHNPAIAGPSKSTAPATIRESSSPSPPSQASEPVENVNIAKTERQSLVDVLDTEAEPKRQSNNVQGDDTTLNEEGLPFHEIRETLDGRPLGPVPSVASGAVEASTTSEKEDDYWSEAAIARREELRRRVFGEGSDTEDEESDQDTAVGTIQPINASSTSIITEQEPSIEPTSYLSTSSENSRQSSISPVTAPKSILKPPTRKKSVSFDSSVPLPAPEPATPSAIAAQKFGFPLPLLSDDTITSTDEFAPRPVPIIAAPHPYNKPSKDDEKGFAGFRRGFLTAPSTPLSSVTASAAPGAVIPAQPSAQSPSSTSATKPPLRERHVSFTEDTAPPAADAPEPKRKTSLFAQRLAVKEIDPSAPSASNGIISNIRSPALSKLSENKPMVAVKSSVVEKAPTPSTSYAASTSRANSTPSMSTDQTGKDNEDDDDEDDEEEELSEYSSVEEDEYDLDEALHAREIALEYHRRQAYQPLNRDLNDPASDELGPGDYNFGGGVMLGLPRIGDDDEGEGRGPTIINPTPDDLKRFIRVGKLENGNLVLAPGEEGFDDTDTDSDEEETGEVDEDGDISGKARKKEMKRRREEIKRQLMGLPPSQVITEVQPKEKSNGQEEEWKASMPPTIVPDTPATPALAKSAAPTVSAVADKAIERTNPTLSSETIQSKSASEAAPASAAPEPTAPKKVSRFKAARMAGGV